MFSGLILSLSLSWYACTGEKDTAETLSPPASEPSVTAVSPALRRLTISQYQNIVTDVFGDRTVGPQQPRTRY